jgi:hypothetical protein
MNTAFLVKLASRNMWRHRARTVMTVAGIAIAIVSFGWSIRGTPAPSWGIPAG